MSIKNKILTKLALFLTTLCLFSFRNHVHAQSDQNEGKLKSNLNLNILILAGAERLALA